MAGIGQIQICNMALSHVGGGRIESMTEGSSEAREVSTWYDPSRLQVLEGFDWSFARKTQLLALHPDAAPEPAWALRYQVPSDLVSPRYLVNPAGNTADAVPFELMASDAGNEMTLVTDLAQATLVYTFDQKSPAMFSSLFVLVLSHVLAANICFSITGKADLKQQQIELANAVMQTAPAHAANQQVSRAPREAEAIRARS
jgi:hypothetical protein